jgi:hypothetical protein
MKSPYDEAIAQLFFWSDMLCLPVAILISILGLNATSIKKSVGCFSIGVLALTHFLWYFTVLGNALASTRNTPPYSLPFWPSFLPYPLLGGLILFVLWTLLDRQRKRRLPPPLPNE